MRTMSVVVVLVLVFGQGCYHYMEKRYEAFGQYVDLVTKPVEPVATWGSRVPTSKEEYEECQGVQLEPFPKKGSTGSVNGKTYVVIGKIEMWVCTCDASDDLEWKYFKFRWDEPRRSNAPEWIEGGCRIDDSALKMLQLLACNKKRHADALLNVSTYCVGAKRTAAAKPNAAVGSSFFAPMGAASLRPDFNTEYKPPKWITFRPSDYSVNLSPPSFGVMIGGAIIKWVDEEDGEEK